jgi:ABC-type multidrug transport system fused ATPase/permease subunit
MVLLQTLDDVDIRDMDLKWLRSQIALISETSVISHHSVADNLKIADSGRCLSDQYLEDVARTTHLHEVIKNLPEVYMHDYFNFNK